MQLKPTEKAKQPSPASRVTVLLEKDCHLEGRLKFEGTARIDGGFTGEIDTPDTLIVGRQARVQGEVTASVVIISGHFQGKICARKRVEICAPALVKGTIESAVLQVEEGAVFEGESKMLRTLENAQETRH